MSSDMWGPVCSREFASAKTQPLRRRLTLGSAGQMRDGCFGARSALVTWRFAACCGLELHPVSVFSNATLASRRHPWVSAFGFGRAYRSRPVRGGCMHAHVDGSGRLRARVSAWGARISVRVAMQRWFTRSGLGWVYAAMLRHRFCLRNVSTIRELSGRLGGPHALRRMCTAHPRVCRWIGRTGNIGMGARTPGCRFGGGPRRFGASPCAACRVRRRLFGAWRGC